MPIRNYQSPDFDILVSIYNESKLDELTNETSLFELIPLQEDKKRLPLFINSTKHVFCEENKKAIGFIGVLDEHISFLFVSKKHRGKSVGKQLLNYVIEQKNKDLTLDVTQSNKIALRLYEKMNFIVCNTFNGEYNGTSVVVNKLKLTR